MILDGAFPDSLTDPMVKALMEEYFRSSNASNPKHPDEASEEGFARLFTKDGVYQLASKKAQGHDGKLFLFFPLPLKVTKSWAGQDNPF